MCGHQMKLCRKHLHGHGANLSIDVPRPGPGAGGLRRLWNPPRGPGIQRAAVRIGAQCGGYPTAESETGARDSGTGDRRRRRCRRGAPHCVGCGSLGHSVRYARDRARARFRISNPRYEPPGRHRVRARSAHDGFPLAGHRELPDAYARFRARRDRSGPQECGRLEPGDRQCCAEPGQYALCDLPVAAYGTEHPDIADILAVVPGPLSGWTVRNKS